MHTAARTFTAYLTTVGGVKVNGVAELHSQLLCDKVLPDFSNYWPDKFTNVTNGITPRRFMRLANPSLSQVITDAIGVGWVTNLDRLEGLEPFAEDPEFRQQFRRAKEANKAQLRALLRVRDGIQLPRDHMLDVMVKRLHEYKRQVLKVLRRGEVDVHPGVLPGPARRRRRAGERKTLRLVAEYADACNIFDTPELAHKLQVLREHCERLGRAYEEIEKTAQLRFDLGPRGERVEQTIEHLHELADLGIEVAHGTLANVRRPGTLDLMAEQVIPAVAAL